MAKRKSTKEQTTTLRFVMSTLNASIYTPAVAMFEKLARPQRYKRVQPLNAIKS
jgi:hypothetical protein